MALAQEASLTFIRLEKISYRIDHFQLEVDLDLAERATGIFGPSGAGKTTLLELIAGLRKPSTGTIHLRGKPLTSISTGQFVSPENRGIGYVPQDLALFPHKTAEANLRYGLKTKPDFLDEVVTRLELQPLLSRYPSQLSGGEKQRIAIGRALIAQPRLLMLDEPLSGLDDDLKQRGLELFRSLISTFRTPILYVSHNPNEIVQLCEESLVLRHGKIVQRGPPRELFPVRSNSIDS
jgi:molybdate transport system ATP-binding protein